jgi:predicted Zn-dependent peptidase
MTKPRRVFATSWLLVLGVVAGITAQVPDRSRPPAVGPAPPLSLPQIQKRQLGNGLRVWMVELHEVPVVQVNLVVMSGAADDPPGKYGAANLTAAMLTEGAASRSSLEIADAIDFLGADLSVASSFDATTTRLHAPVARLGEALAIMADVVLRPTFPIEELERLRQQRLTSLIQARDDAATVAAMTFSRVVYGEAHRFGISATGAERTLKAFTADDLRTFYATGFRPEDAALLVAGDVQPGVLLPLLESHFGAWKAGQRPERTVLPPPSPRRRREVYLVDKPGAPQSQIRIGSVGVRRSTPDYFPIQVMNTILGGSFSSRLNMNLREKHGYTYGATSVFDMRAEPGPFFAAAGVQTDKTSEALREFFNELNGIQPMAPAEELTRAKNYIALRFPGQFETTADMSRRLEELVVYGLPDDYFSRYVQGVEAVTAADVQRAARTYVQPDKVAVVIVGDRKVIEPGLRALNLGPINLLTIDEIFGR